MASAPCSVMFTTERIAWLLDVRPKVVLDAPFEMIYGIGVNWETLELALEITSPSILVNGHEVPPAAPSTFLALWWTDPVDRASLEHALTYVSNRTAGCSERGDVTFNKTTSHIREMRGM